MWRRRSSASARPERPPATQRERERGHGHQNDRQRNVVAQRRVGEQELIRERVQQEAAHRDQEERGQGALPGGIGGTKGPAPLADKADDKRHAKADHVGPLRQYAAPTHRAHGNDKMRQRGSGADGTESNELSDQSAPRPVKNTSKCPIIQEPARRTARKRAPLPRPT